MNTREFCDYARKYVREENGITLNHAFGWGWKFGICEHFLPMDAACDFVSMRMTWFMPDNTSNYFDYSIPADEINTMRDCLAREYVVEFLKKSMAAKADTYEFTD